MILANTLFQCVCYHPEEFQIITSGTDRKVSTPSRSQDPSGTRQKQPRVVAQGAGAGLQPHEVRAQSCWGSAVPLWKC